MTPAPSSSYWDLGVPDTPTAWPRVSFLSGQDGMCPSWRRAAGWLWVEAAPHPTPGQGHPRLHLLILSALLWLSRRVGPPT